MVPLGEDQQHEKHRVSLWRCLYMHVCMYVQDNWASIGPLGPFVYPGIKFVI